MGRSNIPAAAIPRMPADLVPQTAAAILAGGQARRFDGHDKSRLIVEGRSIIVRQLEILQQVAAQVCVIGPPERFADIDVAAHPDVRSGLGAIGGLLTALEVTDAEYVLVVACDLPFLSAGLLETLREKAQDGDGAWVRTERGVEPLLGCYRRRVRDIVLAQIDRGRLKMSDLGAVLNMRELVGRDLEAFGPVERLLANVNTPDDYARVQYRVS